MDFLAVSVLENTRRSLTFFYISIVNTVNINYCTLVIIHSMLIKSLLCMVIENLKKCIKHVVFLEWVTAVIVQFSSVTQSCPTLCNFMHCSTPGLPVQHQLPEFTQTHVPLVSDAIQPSHPLPSPSPCAPNPSQHQSLFQWVNSSHEVAKVLEFQL